MFLLLIRWWYNQGMLLTIRRTEHRFQRVARQFSVGQLAGSLFAPWRRIVSSGGKGPGEVLQDAISNAVSRGVGFGVRFIVLITALFVFIAVGVVFAVEIMVWNFLPLAIVYFLIRGIVG